MKALRKAPLSRRKFLAASGAAAVGVTLSGKFAMALKLLDLRRPDNIPGAEPVPRASAEAKSDEGQSKRAD